MNPLRTSIRNGSGMGCLFVFVCGVISALIWWGEQPSTLATLACALCVCGIAVWVVRFAKKHNACADSNLWLRLIGIRLLLATILIGFFWYEPDLSHRTSSMQSDGLGFDPVRWDEMGEQLAIDGILGSSQTIYRYGKEGLIYYIASIYSIFGVGCVYVAWFNALIAVATLLLLTYWLREHFGSQRRWDLMAYGLFIPESLWYGSLALKEVHNGFLFVLFMVSYDRLFSNASTKTAKQQWLIFMCLAVVGIFIFQRIHFVTMGGFALLACCLHFRSKRSLSPILVIGLIFDCVLVFERFVSSDVELILRENEQVGSAVLRGSDMFATEDSINTMLIGNTIMQKALFCIPRTVMFAVTPFPRLEIWSYWGIKENDWQSLGSTATRISIILLLWLSPALVATSVKSFTNTVVSVARIPLAMYVACLFAMANGVMMFQERWRSSVWPIWLALILLGWPYRKEYYWIVPVAVTAGAVLFMLLKMGF